MKTMILDTSSQKLIISFIDDGITIYNHISDGKNNHSDNLIKYITEGLDKLGLEVADFNRVIVGIGPGAYTGLRVALCVAKVFCWSKNSPLFTVSSLDLLASGYFKTEGTYALMIHAKNGFVYHKVLSVGDKVNVLENDSFRSIEEAEEINAKYKDIVIVNNDNINFDGLNITCDLIKEEKDVFFLEPNYLREGM